VTTEDEFQAMLEKKPKTQPRAKGQNNAKPKKGKKK
jgi:hypothetical protein